MIPNAIKRRLAGPSAGAMLRPARGAARAVLAMVRPRGASVRSVDHPPRALMQEAQQAGASSGSSTVSAVSGVADDAWAAYRLWISTVEDAERSGVVYVRPAELSGELRYSLLLPDPAEGRSLMQTLSSLVAQDNLCWELLLPASCPAAVRRAVSSFASDTSERVVFVDCGDAADRGAVLDQLLAAAGGGWIAALAEGDVLAPHALDEFDAALSRNPRVRILYSDEDELDEGGERVFPLFKPEYAPEQLHAFNYLGRLCFIDRRLALTSGGFGAGRGAGAEWSLNLRAADAATVTSCEVRRIPRVLCHRGAGGFRDRGRPNSVASIACKAALTDHWRSLGIREPRVTTQPDGTHRSTWTLERTPLVSVIVPNHDKPDLLRVCADGVLDGTDYPSVEFIVVENRSTDPETLRLYAELAARPNVTIIRVDTPFNYSAACNRGAEVARGELLLFLNNDIQVVDPGWLGELVRVASLPGVGVVGTKLNYPDGTLQHAGVVAGVALYTLLFNRGTEGQFGVFGSPDHTRNCLALMGACQMVRRETFDAVGGFDEAYELAYSDVALSMRAWKAGWRNAYTPFAALVHHEGKTRGFSNPPRDTARVAAELGRLGIVEDPFFHPELSSRDAVPRFLVDGEPRPGDLLDLLQRQLASETPPPDATLDLCDTPAVEAATRLSRTVLLWPPQPGAGITDRIGAARFLIDLLRSRPDLRLRFPHALTAGARGAFSMWLAGEGRGAFALTDAALVHIRGALDGDISGPVRQYLMWRDDIRTRYPLGFLPAGRRSFLEWTMGEAFRASSKVTEIFRRAAFEVEAVWWLFLTCAEDPEGELVRTYLFTPDWQRAHPYGLTVFGRERFAAWLAERYALSTDHRWLDPASWTTVTSPAEDLRLAYDGRHDWRLAHPDALASETGARALLTWLVGPGARLPAEQRAWCTARLGDGTAAELARPGVNVLGHFCYRSGLRVSVEAMSDAMEAAGLLVSRRDIRTHVVDEPHHIDFIGGEIYDVTVIHAQPEPFFDDAHGRADVAERQRRTHRAAYWYWELDTAPVYWGESARQVDELWTATRFVADALRGVTDKPVHTLFPGVRLARFTTRSRAHFGLPAREDGRFAFLFSFHMGSVMERKNPLGLIESFRIAFGEDEPVDLVLKTTSFGNHDAQLAELAEAAGTANVCILDRVLDEDDITALMDSCDAYVSLHRSEGLGLTMAEAMLLGKPVVATRYSGNLDFMDDDNSLLVDCEIVPIRGTVPPYTVPGARWAEPSTAHAAELMRRVYDDVPFREALGRRAKQSAESNLSIAAAGQRFAERIDAIRSASAGS